MAKANTPPISPSPPLDKSLSNSPSTPPKPNQNNHPSPTKSTTSAYPSILNRISSQLQNKFKFFTLILLALFIFILIFAYTMQPALFPHLAPTQPSPDTDQSQQSGQNLQEFESDEKQLESYTVTDQATGNIVSNFPDLPQYPGATIINSSSYTEEEGIGFSTQYQISDSLTNIFNWYHQALTQLGWEVSYATQFDQEPRSFLLEVIQRGVTEKDTIVLAVSGLKKDEDTAQITLTYHQGMGEYGPATNDE